jgi:hypothetical protein
VKAFLDNFAAVLSAATFAVLAMSVTHEYAYFWSIGPQFQTFLTTTDYLANGVLWLPLGIIIVWIYGDWSNMDPPTSRLAGWQRVIGNILAVAFVLFVALTATWPVSFISGILIFSLAVGWWHVRSRRLAGRIKLEEPFQALAWFAIRVGPPILLGMFIWGSVNASSDLTRTDNAYNFRFAGESADRSAIFLRNFDKGVLLRDPVGNNIEFHRWDNIVTISGPVTKTTSIGCRLFNWCVVLAPPS